VHSVSTSQVSVHIEDYSPRDGDHLCSLWTDPVTDRAVGTRFLAGGDAAERGLWILDSSRDGECGIPADFAAGSGPFIRYSTDRVHVEGGRFDPDRMRGFWSSRAAETAPSGAKHLRAVAEMAWALRALPGTDQAPAFESSLNPHLHSLPLSVICQYGSTKFSAEILLAMILSHPLVVIGDRVMTNPFSIDHEHFPERFAALRGDSQAALVPMWSHFLHELPSTTEVATFLCNSLPTLIGAERVWVTLHGMPEPLMLEVATDRVTATDLEPVRRLTLDRRGRLYGLWPGSERIAGGAVQFGMIEGLGVLESTYYRDTGRIIVTRTDAFARPELARFATIASEVARAMVGTLN